jgi:hypothetical protein
MENLEPYPEDDKWKDLPFGKLLQDSFLDTEECDVFNKDKCDPKTCPNPDKGVNCGKKFKLHNKEVFEAITKLLNSNFSEVCKMIHPDEGDGGDLYKNCRDAIRGTHVSPSREKVKDYKDTLNTIAADRLLNNDLDLLRELRYAAIFHDIGKTIIYDRHPVVGWHIIADLHKEARIDLITKLGEEKYRTLLLLIRDHDKFGVLSTGEASLPILTSVAKYHENQKEEARRSVAKLFLLTLADIAATQNARPVSSKGEISLDDQKVLIICKDWIKFDKILTDTEGQREKLVKETIRESQTQSSTIERIHRLILDSSRGYEKLNGALQKKELIDDAMEDAFGPNLDAFCRELALIAKFDYCLYFLRDLMKYANDEELIKKQKDLAQVVSDVVEIVLAILRRITATYRGLTEGMNAIGVGFEHLRHQSEDEKRKTIIDLLFTRRERALRWLVDEIAGWQVN